MEISNVDFGKAAVGGFLYGSALCLGAEKDRWIAFAAGVIFTFIRITQAFRDPNPLGCVNPTESDQSVKNFQNDFLVSFFYWNLGLIHTYNAPMLLAYRIGGIKLLFSGYIQVVVHGFIDRFSPTKYKTEAKSAVTALIQGATVGTIAKVAGCSNRLAI